MAKKGSTAQSTTQLPPGTLLKRLRGSKKRMDNGIQEARGTYGQEVADAVENKHLHKKAWAAVMKEDRMEPEALRLYYEHLDHYRDELGLIKRAESAPDLPMDEDEDGEETDNVTQMPAARVN